MDNVIKPIFEFILWDNCKNNCRFCWQKKHYCKLNEIQKRDSITKVAKFLDSKDFIRGSHVLLVGGELFDTYEIGSSGNLMFLVDTITRKMITGDIDLFYVNTNLIYEDFRLLDQLLFKMKVKGLVDRLKFTTSYDVFGRFGTQKIENCEELWFDNLDYIKLNYPNVNVVINTILSEQYCHSVIDDNNKDLVKRFREEYGYYVNLLPYVSINDELTPKRNDVFRTLRITENNNNGYLEGYIRNFDLPQKKLIYRYVDGNLVFSSSDYNECGHGINFNMYSGSKTCFICDIKELFNVG